MVQKIFSRFSNIFFTSVQKLLFHRGSKFTKKIVKIASSPRFVNIFSPTFKTFKIPQGFKLTKLWLRRYFHVFGYFVHQRSKTVISHGSKFTQKAFKFLLHQMMVQKIFSRFSNIFFTSVQKLLSHRG